MNTNEIEENYRKEARKFDAATKVFEAIRDGFDRGNISYEEYNEARPAYTNAMESYDKAYAAARGTSVAQHVEKLSLAPPVIPEDIVKGITESYYSAKRLLSAAQLVLDNRRKGFIAGTVTDDMYESAKQDYEIAQQRYDTASVEFERDYSPTMKQIVEAAIPGILSPETLAVMNEPIMVTEKTVPVMLTEDQLGLLKACTAAQKELLQKEGKDYPQHQEACWDQSRECTQLFDILTTAQFIFINDRDIDKIELTDQEIRDNFEGADKLFNAAMKKFDPIRKAHEVAMVYDTVFEEARAEYINVMKRYEIAYAALKLMEKGK